MMQLTNSQNTSLQDLPVNALRAFLATANHLSLTRAADELNVTPGAVGRQVHQLEKKLNIKLVQREGNRLTLTVAGEVALPRLRDAFEGLCLAVDEIKQQAAAPGLTICVDISFASTWLAPKLSQFRDLHHCCDIRIIPPISYLSPIPRNVDFVITYAKDSFSDCDIKLLHRETLLPVCTQAYLKNHPSLEQPSDLINHQLISIDQTLQDIAYPGWNQWSEKFANKPLVERSTTHVALAILATQAALSNQGVALLSTTLVGHYLQNGELISPLSEEFSIDMPRYVISARREKSPISAQFQDWLMSLKNTEE